MVKIKIGFSGPPCSGKTTTVHEVVVELRKRGIKVDVLSGIERIPLYNVNRMYDVTEHNISFVNHILQESLHSKRPDIDVLLVDRTVLDIWIDMDITAVVKGCKKCEFIKKAIQDYTNNWLKTYDLIFKFNAVEFKDDGLRLNDMAWRNELIEYYKHVNEDDTDLNKNIIPLKIIDILFISDVIIEKLRVKKENIKMVPELRK